MTMWLGSWNLDEGVAKKKGQTYRQACSKAGIRRGCAHSDGGFLLPAAWSLSEFIRDSTGEGY